MGLNDYVRAMDPNEYSKMFCDMLDIAVQYDTHGDRIDAIFPELSNETKVKIATFAIIITGR